MTAPVWARRFPGGVADASGEHALWRNSQGRVVALRLVDGCELWRTTDAMWPLLVDGEIALALSFDPPRIVALDLRSSDGNALWRSAVLPWPDWARTRPDIDPGIELNAARVEGGALLCWSLRERYAGGAPPSVHRADAVSGACGIDLRSGRLEGLDRWPAPPAPSTQEPSPDPAIVARATFADVDYRLALRKVGASTRTVLVAHNKTHGRSEWERELETVAAREPRALRP